jgi:hypothetical protein
LPKKTNNGGKKMKKLSKSLGLIISLGVITVVVFSLTLLPRYETKASVNDEHANHKHTQIAEFTKFAKKENARLNQQQPDPSVTDEIAYGLALRFISKSDVEAENKATRLYLAYVMGVESTSDQNILMEKGRQYKLASNQIQMQAENITATYHPTHSTISSTDENRLKQLSKNKEKLIKDSIRDLERDLSQQSWQFFKDSVLTKVKPKVKTNRH